MVLEDIRGWSGKASASWRSNVAASSVAFSFESAGTGFYIAEK